MKAGIAIGILTLLGTSVSAQQYSSNPKPGTFMENAIPPEWIQWGCSLEIFAKFIQ